jgi:hypothetical protein
VFAPPDGPAVDELKRARREAAIWCDVSGRSSSFRTSELRPLLPEWPTAGDLETAIQTLVLSRRNLLSAHRVTDVPRGRLLVCNVNESISSGESEAETLGFFDINDRPPWDTWVTSVPCARDSSEATLISWVPLRLVDIVDRGIKVNPYECVYWLSDAERVLAQGRSKASWLSALNQRVLD